jgi:DNA modification methylase
MKKQGLFEIYVSGELVYSTSDEYAALDKLQDLAVDYYSTGTPDPSTIEFVRHGETQSIIDWEDDY